MDTHQALIVLLSSAFHGIEGENIAVRNIVVLWIQNV